MILRTLTARDDSGARSRRLRADLAFFGLLGVAVVIAAMIPVVVEVILFG